jgi:hypothetical protein
VAWNHDGTDMGEAGLKLGPASSHSALCVQAGPYASGFAQVTLNGSALSVARGAVLRLSGGVSLQRRGPSQLDVTTPRVAFSLLTSDGFINIERAVLRASADSSSSSSSSTLPADGHAHHGHAPAMEGLLGQTADKHWRVLRTASWWQHIESDFLLPLEADLMSTTSSAACMSEQRLCCATEPQGC